MGTRNLESTEQVELIRNLSKSATELAEALLRLAERLEAVKGLEWRPVGNTDASEPERPRVSSIAPESWVLASGGLLLQAPSGDELFLSQRERLFLTLIFHAPQREVSFEEACHVTNAAGHAVAGTVESLAVLVSRLRAKWRNKGIDFPIRSVRGEGYFFAADAKVV